MEGTDEALTVGERFLADGLSQMAARDFPAAAHALRRAVQTPEAPALWWTCLAQALFMTGAFAECVDAFETASAQDALPPNALAVLAQARCLRDLIEGGASAETVLKAYTVEAGLEPEALLAFSEQAVLILAGFQRADAAARVGRWRLDHGPADPVLLYRQAVLEGQVLTRAPADYIERHFDDFADRFDHQLVDLLGYSAPADLALMVARLREDFADVVDLGCGTGLAAAGLRPIAKRLVGVDLSAMMLAKCAARGGYDTLVKADIVAFLRERPGAFDLIFAADVLIYLGDLADFFGAAAAALRPGGLLALTTEQTETGWKVLGSGRFAHADAYLDATARGLSLLDRKDIVLRQEAGQEVPGAAHIYARPH